MEYLKEKAGKITRIFVFSLLSFAFFSVASLRAALRLGVVGGRGVYKGTTLHDAYQTSGVMGDLCRSL